MFIIFRPTQNTNSSLEFEYLQAAAFGRNNYDCSQIYKSCISNKGILNHISKIII